jgi:glycosyltransferase involved in cell wall biosynthesis
MASRPPLAGRVIFAGLVPASDVADYLALMDVLVHLSRREGLPRVLPQALAAGVPVVAADCDGAPEVCLDGETGFLVPADAPAVLVERLAMLALDPDLGRALAARGRLKVQGEFGTQRMVDDLATLYGELIRRFGLGRGDHVGKGVAV